MTVKRYDVRVTHSATGGYVTLADYNLIRSHLAELQKMQKKYQKLVEQQRQQIGGLLDENRRLLDNLKIIVALNKGGVTAQIVEGVVLPLRNGEQGDDHAKFIRAEQQRKVI